ncbi:MAG TPA: RNA polymerase sigma factor [Gemmatimonadaceae bacterium]|nr:RNA polymerase sigma factor [Gemmatimonadaceae bacterium]
MNPGSQWSVEHTDEELIERWKAGDSRAATEIVRRHADALARFATSAGEREEIEELVQDTLVRAFNSLDSFRAESSLRTWLFTIERRLILDRRRAEKREKNIVSLEGADAATDYDALDNVVATETARRVRQAMSKLSPMQRDVFTMRVEQGLAYKEIASILGTTEGAARVHYHNAVRAVKEQLND